MMIEPIPAVEHFRPALNLPAIPYDYLLRSAAERYPNRMAIIAGQQSLTYREVVLMVNRVANGLRALGVAKGERICLLTINCPEYTITLNAAATIGAVVTPMSPAFKERELAYRLLDSGTSTIVVHRTLIPLLQSVLTTTELPTLKHIITVDEDEGPARIQGAIPFTRLLNEFSSVRPESVAINLDDVFILPYSSGTTGLPKGVMLSHRNLTSNHLQFLAATGVRETDSTILFIPLCHIYGVMLTGSFLAAGATQVLVDGFDVVYVLDLCEKYALTWFFATPPVIQALAAFPNLSKMKTVKCVMNAAAAIPPKPARIIAERLGICVAQGYGMTEASPVTHCSPIRSRRAQVENVGTLVSNTQQKIVDAETGMRELPPGEEGEVIISGPQVMLGYWNAPEETARALRNGWLYTGDIGYLDADGFLYLMDRKKEMIKYKGYSIAPAELEGLLLEHPCVIDAAVVGKPDEESGEVPKGLVVLQKGTEATEDEVLTFVNDKLASHKKLHEVEFLDAIPKIPSGKILRRELKDRERARQKR